ncbi:hypothetical protein VMCG_07884 [Cytospora schulzeri]|uniref:Pentacotripeptide-repeat region of PRORP domain-containing protein n=1 Tax=Cytospora schulzeri TaxID=448051 RepID=A0A423W0B8_9PEZI|nr:hypothetical protein VMCG_07884 [Valsa malicola]
MANSSTTATARPAFAPADPNQNPASTTDHQNSTDEPVHVAGDRLPEEPPLQEDIQVVAIDEAFDNDAQKKYGNADEADDVSTTSDFPEPQNLGADSTQQAEAKSSSEQVRALPAPSRRDKNQLSFLKSRIVGMSPAVAVAEFKYWKQNFAGLNNSQSTEPAPRELKMLNWLLIHDNVETMRAILHSHLPEKTKRERDRLLLYVALKFVPERAPIVLEALCADTIPHSYMVEDALQYLSMHLGKLDPAGKKAFAVTLAELAGYIIDHSTTQYIQLTQNSIHAIMDALPAEKVASWFKKLIEGEQPLHRYTMLHFARRLARAPETKLVSLDIMRDLCGGNALDINTPVGASLCSSILTFEEIDLLAMDEDHVTPAELFQCILDLGLVPNVITYTAIIRDLCLKKELATALDVFEVMRQHGIDPDPYTYSVIINGCKSCGDFDTLIRFAVEARESNIHDPYIWNDLIHATFLACLKEPRQKGGPRRPRYMVWGPMNAIFTRFFDPQPLRPLIAAQLTEVRDWMDLQGIIPTQMKGAFVELRPLPPRELWQPSSATLGIMLMGFVRHLPRPYDVIIFYSHFRELLKQGDPTAELLVREQGSLIHDIVLRALLKWKGTLRVMLDIIRDMMRDFDPVAAGTSTSPSATPTSQPPDGSSHVSNAETPLPTEDLSSSSKPETPLPEYSPSVSGAEQAFNDLEEGVESSPLDAHTSPPVDGPLPFRNGAALPDDSPLVNGTEAHYSHPEEVLDQEHANPESSMADAETTPAGTEPEQAASPPIRHPRPSVHTWSILLKAFMFNQLPGQAEQVIKLMQHHGISPNLVTWNTLAASYAKLGRTKQAVEAMRRLEAAGYKSDDWTLRAFSYISDKGRAIRLMERTVEQNRLTKMAMEQAQVEDEKRHREKQQLIEDEIRERDHQQERLPRDERQQRQDEMDALSDDVSREVYEEMVKMVGKSDDVEKPDDGDWDEATWDDTTWDQPQGARPSKHGESR